MALKNLFGKITKTGELLFHAAGIKEIIDFTKNLAKDKKVQGKAAEITQKALDGKGLTDEAAFELSLVDAEDTHSSSNFSLIRTVMGNLQTEDEKNGTKFARNARLIVLLNDVNFTGKKTVPIYKKGKVSGSTTINVDDKDRPSVKILKRLGKKDSLSEDDIRQFFINIGAFQNAPMGTLDEFQWWLRHSFIKKIKSYAESTGFYTELLIEELSAFTEEQYYREEERIHRARTAPWVSDDGFFASIPVFFKKLALIIFEA